LDFLDLNGVGEMQKKCAFDHKKQGMQSQVRRENMTSPTDVSDSQKPVIRESAAEQARPGHFRYVVLGMIFAITVIARHWLRQ